MRFTRSRVFSVAWFLLTARGGYFAVDLVDKTLKHLARAEFDKLVSSVGNHVLHALSPAHGCGELSHEVSLDFSGIGVRLGIDVLVNRHNGSVDLSLLDCF